MLEPVQSLVFKYLTFFVVLGVESASDYIDEGSFECFVAERLRGIEWNKSKYQFFQVPHDLSGTKPVLVSLQIVAQKTRTKNVFRKTWNNFFNFHCFRFFSFPHSDALADNNKNPKIWKMAIFDQKHHFWPLKRAKSHKNTQSP